MVNHEQLPDIVSADLPATYEKARTALAECSRIDECKDWTDKAMALASYARQSKDDSLRKMAERIKARAIRRAGEILKQIEPATGAHLKGGGTPTLSRKEAGEAAGMSKDQQVQATRVANVPEEEFNSSVESDNPPTITKLADMGRKRQAVDLKGRDPKEFNTALHFLAIFDRHIRELEKCDIESGLQALTDAEANRLRKSIEKIDSYHDQIITRV